MTELTATEKKQLREKQEREALRLARRDDTPPSTDLSAILGPEKAAAVSTVEMPPPAPLQAAEATETVEAEETPAPVKKTPQNAVKRAATPWSLANPRMTVPFTTRMSEETHMKLTFLKNTMPNTSIQKIVKQAVEAEVERLLKIYYKH
jgi:hypothetical protein